MTQAHLSTQRPLRVGFVLSSPPERPLPSTRIAVLNIVPKLAALGIDTQIAFAPATATETPALPPTLADDLAAGGVQVAVLQKTHGPSALALCAALRERGIASVFLVCDVVDAAMATACDATVVVTDFLRSLYPAALQARVHVVHDGIERPAMRRSAAPTRRPGRPLQAVLVASSELDHLPVLGNPPSWLSVIVVANYAPQNQRAERLRRDRWAVQRQRGWGRRWHTLRFLTHPRIQRVPWHAEGVYEQLMAADVGIIPIDTTEPAAAGAPAPAWQVKSENRLTLMMAAALPVVATPIPSYLPVLQHGQDGYLANNRAEWLQHLSTLRDPEVRLRIGEAARIRVLHPYSQEEQARKLAAVLRAVAFS